jgi:fatty acid desaturase
MRQWHIRQRVDYVAVQRLIGCGPLAAGRRSEMEVKMTWRTSGPMDIRTAAAMLLLAAFCYSAWLTSIVFCAGNGMRPLLVAGAAFFPVGIVHGIGVWFGGW